MTTAVAMAMKRTTKVGIKQQARQRERTAIMGLGGQPLVGKPGTPSAALVSVPEKKSALQRRTNGPLRVLMAPTN
jgi:hypothetical protein